jgi:hypothetical protein
MQAKERRQIVTLAVLLAALAVVVWWQLGSAIPSRPAPVRSVATARPSTARAPGQRDGTTETGPVVVHLAWLDQPRPEPITEQRDPFVFGVSRELPVPPQAGGGPEGVATPDTPEGPPEPPPPPPIPYRFIGVLDAPGTGQVAVLSDGRFVYHGREGDIIDGRYRLVSVTDSSVQLEYLDGRGRQTLRLSGS